MSSFFRDPGSGERIFFNDDFCARDHAAVETFIQISIYVDDSGNRKQSNVERLDMSGVNDPRRYDFSERPGAGDGLPGPAETDRRRQQPSGFPGAQDLMQNESKWMPLMHAMQTGIDYSYKCIDSPEHLIASEVLAAMRSCPAGLPWQRAETGFYTTGATHKKPFVMAHMSASSGALNHPVVLIAFPGMGPCWSDIRSALSVTAQKLPGSTIEAHEGFLESALSVVHQIDAFLGDLPAGSYQIVFVGHSMGGAVAYLSSLMYSIRHAGALKDNDVLVYTMGQPKTIKVNHADAANALVRAQNYVRFVTYAQNIVVDNVDGELIGYQSPQGDSIAGYRSSAVDTISCVHAGQEYPLQIHKVMTFMFGAERIMDLHFCPTYWDAMQTNARKRFDRSNVQYHHSGHFAPTVMPVYSCAQSWSCCASPFVDQVGCLRGLPTQHRGTWDALGNRWACCQQAGKGKRAALGCSMEYFQTVVLGPAQARFDAVCQQHKQVLRDVEFRKKCHDDIQKRKCDSKCGREHREILAKKYHDALSKAAEPRREVERERQKLAEIQKIFDEIVAANSIKP